MTDVRNLIIGCDGTWNEPVSDTNVSRFLDAVYLNGRQDVHYEKGVGTRADEKLTGGGLGIGLEKRILGAYRYLRKKFNQNSWSPEQNRIFLLGFSRGAYTARRVSGLLAHSGVPKKAEDVNLGWQMYLDRDTEQAAGRKREGRFWEVPVEMVGVWDTVKTTADPNYNDTQLPLNVAKGYHAMAIDERRLLFPVLKWKKDPRVLQVWFAGVHSDVGGGYPETGLSDIALRWMIYRAAEHGVEYNDNVKALKPRPKGKMHDSLTGFWVTLGEKARSIAKNEWIHKSVAKRLEGNYKPNNLPDPPRFWEPA